MGQALCLALRIQHWTKQSRSLPLGSWELKNERSQSCRKPEALKWEWAWLGWAKKNQKGRGAGEVSGRRWLLPLPGLQFTSWRHTPPWWFPEPLNTICPKQKSLLFPAKSPSSSLSSHCTTKHPVAQTKDLLNISWICPFSIAMIDPACCVAEKINKKLKTQW